MIVSNVEWTTSAPAIATVNTAGVVTAVAAGDVQITAHTSLGYQSARLTVSPLFAVGDLFGGGTVCYVDNSGVHGLIAGAENQGTWSSGGGGRTNATSLTDGAANTSTIVSTYGNSGSYAALLAKNYRGGGFSDWFLPALNQLQACRPVVESFHYFWSSSEIDANSAWIIVNYSPQRDSFTKFLINYVLPVRVF